MGTLFRPILLLLHPSNTKPTNMKQLSHLFSLMLVLLAPTVMQAQSRRQLVLIEEFTNTGCGPCANYAPTLDSVVTDRLGEAIAIKFHGYYPDPRDPFYLDQKETQLARSEYYDVTGYPTTIINGEVVGNGLSATSLNRYIDEQLKAERSYALALTTSVSDGTLSFTATLTPDIDVADASQLRLYVVAIEEYYESPTAFANGETEMQYTMRRMLPSADGHELGASLTAATAYEYSGTCPLDNFHDAAQLGVVAFLQDNATKRVLTTAYVPRGAQTETQALLMHVMGTPDYVCTPNLYGQAVIRNMGSQPLTSATLHVSVNGQDTPLPWTGSLAYLEKDTISFTGVTDFTFTTTGDNSVEYWLGDINQTDGQSNTVKRALHNAISAEQAVQLRLYTDRKPEETTWQVLNSADEVVATGGPYADKRTFYTADLPLHADDCYRLVFHDSGNDGIVGDYGNGYYQLFQIKDGQKTRIAQDSYATGEHTVAFRLSQASATSIANLTLHADEPALLTDTHGRILARTTAGRMASLLARQPKGVYLLTAGGQTNKVMNQ